MAASYLDGAGGPLSYIMLEGDEETFSVDAYAGGVRLLRRLDAETELSHTVVVTTREVSYSRDSVRDQSLQAASLPAYPGAAHNVTLTVLVRDVNDWIPAFVSSSYAFVVRVGPARNTWLRYRSSTGRHASWYDRRPGGSCG